MNHHKDAVIRKVVSYICANEPVDFDQIQQAFPHTSKATLQKALTNAMSRREVFRMRRGIGTRAGPQVTSLWRSARPGDYEPDLTPEVLAIAPSVWDLAAPPILTLTGQGTKYSLLGPWTEPEMAEAV